jgi:hypothetical protein
MIFDCGTLFICQCWFIFCFSFLCNSEGVKEGILWMVESVKNNSVIRPPVQKEITWPTHRHGDLTDSRRCYFRCFLLSFTLNDYMYWYLSIYVGEGEIVGRKACYGLCTLLLFIFMCWMSVFRQNIFCYFIGYYCLLYSEF